MFVKTDGFSMHFNVFCRHENVFFDIFTFLNGYDDSIIWGFVGAGRFGDADNSVIHTIISTLIVSAIVLITGIFFLDDLIVLFDASCIGTYCLSYGQPIFLISIVFPVECHGVHFAMNLKLKRKFENG